MASTSTSTPSSSSSINVRTSDGKTVVVTEAVAAQFTVLKHMMEDCNGAEIPLTDIDENLMTRIVTWGEKHTSEAKALSGGNPKEWETGFAAALDQDTLRRLLLAADFLGGAELVDFCADTTARLIRGKTYKEIRELLNIKTDLTPEEEEAIINRNPWAFE